MYYTLLDKNTYMYPQISGSYAEGFRFRSSDRDYMIIYRHIKLLSNNSRLYSVDNSNQCTALFMETDQTRPGFALLKLVSRSDHEVVTRSTIRSSQGIYLSSTLWREVIPKLLPNSKSHGPCESGEVGVTEIDFANCLKCDTWPKSANACIARLLKVGWPSANVVRTILMEGCHLVAIGGKGSPTENIEWRISFSFADKTLIHQMNHCQFLCYGLLKILLKEAIAGIEQETLLCSYFLKTAVLWEILENPTEYWTSSNFFNCFWACFGRLIGWVMNECCPNIFIPENNMFYGKIHGDARQRLLDPLVGLYNKGVYCLLRCQSMQPLTDAIRLVVQQPFIRIRFTDDDVMNSKARCDAVLFEEIQDVFFKADDILVLWKALSLMRDCDDEISRVALYMWKRYAIQYVLVYSNHFVLESPITTNKRISIHCRRVLRAMRHFACDALHHRLLSAVYMYRYRDYCAVLKILRHTKFKLQQRNVMYEWGIDVGKCISAGAEHTPFFTMIRKVFVIRFYLQMIFCVPELTMEYQKVHSFIRLSFPPLIMIYFLLYLCHHHMNQYTEAGEVLQELTVLVKYDEGHHIPYACKALSLTMLGICQEMSGDLASAYESYCAASNDKFNLFKDATSQRICKVLSKINVT